MRMDTLQEIVMNAGEADVGGNKLAYMEKVEKLERKSRNNVISCCLHVW